MSEWLSWRGPDLWLHHGLRYDTCVSLTIDSETTAQVSRVISKMGFVLRSSQRLLDFSAGQSNPPSLSQRRSTRPYADTHPGIPDTFTGQIQKLAKRWLSKVGQHRCVPLPLGLWTGILALSGNPIQIPAASSLCPETLNWTTWSVSTKVNLLGLEPKKATACWDPLIWLSTWFVERLSKEAQIVAFVEKRSWDLPERAFAQSEGWGSSLRSKSENVAITFNELSFCKIASRWDKLEKRASASISKLGPRQSKEAGYAVVTCREIKVN